MSGTTPATAEQVYGAYDHSEVRVSHILGPHKGLSLYHKTSDPGLNDAISSGQVLVDAISGFPTLAHDFVNSLPANFLFTRASKALARNASGTYVEFGTDTPRFSGFLGGLVIEPARTNNVRNPRCEGTLHNGIPALLRPTVAGGIITGVTIVSGGSGYTSAPTISVVVPSGQGSGATITSSITGGVVTGTTITNGGTGYNQSVGLYARPNQALTNWSNGAFHPIARGTENGVDYVEYRYRLGVSGTGGTLYNDLVFDTTGAAAAQTQTWTESVFLKMVGGALTNITNTSVILYGGPSFSDNGTTAVSLTSTFTRYSATKTFTNATTNSANARFSVTATGGDVDITIRFGWPQLEQSAFMTSPILPVAGTPAVTTRAADTLSVLLTTLGVGAGGATVVVSGVVTDKQALSEQAILSLDPDTGVTDTCENVILKLNSQEVVGRGFYGGAARSDQPLGTVALNAPFKVATTFIPPRSFQHSMNGNSSQSRTESNSGATFAILRLGNRKSPGWHLAGRLTRIEVYMPPAEPHELSAYSRV